MSVSSLRSAVNALQSQINELERENNRIRNEISSICDAVQNARSDIDYRRESIANTMDNTKDVMEYADDMMLKTSQTQDAITLLYYNFKNVETANKTIRMLYNKLYFDLKGYRIVRKIVRGFLDNFDLKMVSSETIFKAIEKEQLEEPDYWLTCALLAIMYWQENNKVQAEKALDKALEINLKYSAMFFFLFNLKLGRNDVALKWFSVFSEQEQIGSDNQAILLILSLINVKIDQEDAKNESENVFIQYIEKKLLESKAESESGINRIKDFYVRLEKLPTEKFESLRQYVSDYDELDSAFKLATNNQKILENLVGVERVLKNEKNVFIDMYFDQILDIPSEKEVVIRNQIQENEDIILTCGDKVSAKEISDNRKTHEESALNLCDEIINWLYFSDGKGITTLTKWNMFKLIKDYADKALEMYRMEYKSLIANSHEVTINDFSIETDLSDISSDIKKVDTFFNNKQETQLNAVKDSKAIALLAGGIVTAIGGVVGGIALGHIVLLVGLCLVGVGCSLGGLFGFLGNKKKRLAVIEKIKAEISATKAKMEKVHSDYKRYSLLFDEADKVFEDIKIELKKI